MKESSTAASAARQTETESDEKPLRYVIQNLEKTFGVPILREKSSPLEMLVQVILSQATSDVLSERTFTALKEKFSGWDEILERLKNQCTG